MRMYCREKVTSFALLHVVYRATVYPKAAKRSIPLAPLLSLNGSTVMIAAAELHAYN